MLFFSAGLSSAILRPGNALGRNSGSYPNPAISGFTEGDFAFTTAGCGRLGFGPHQGNDASKATRSIAVMTHDFQEVPVVGCRCRCRCETFGMNARSAPKASTSKPESSATQISPVRSNINAAFGVHWPRRYRGLRGLLECLDIHPN